MGNCPGVNAMDSHSFRIVAGELAALLRGARVEKIHEPRPGVYVFLLFAGGKKRRLLMRCERQLPQLFFTDVPLSNPPSPSAGVMRLRKYCQGRRLGEAAADFVSRRMAFALPTAPGAQSAFLVLDMTNGPSVAAALPGGFASAPPWPGAAVIDALCDGTPHKEDMPHAPWRDFAVLTPSLRETLACLDPMEGRALMVDLEAGGEELFLYMDASGKPACYSAWPFPEALCARKGLLARHAFEEAAQTAGGGAAPSGLPALAPDFPALSLVALVEEPFFLQRLGAVLHREQALPERKKAKKHSRLMAKLEQEEQRLRGMLAMREDAKALQAVLWRYAPEEKPSFVSLPQPGEGGAGRRLPLDPRLTVRENMEKMFKQSDRGARGLAMLAQRRADAMAAEQEGVGAAPRPAAAQGEGGRFRPPPSGEKHEKDVARFASADGFVLLRGKNARGNQRLLKLGSGHDLWLHAEGGPSAHLIIRRAHAAEEVPERTLLEAAALVAEKSWQRHDDKAGVMVALLRHVQAVKGAPPGTVRVEKIARSLVVRPGAGEEEDDGVA